MIFLKRKPGESIVLETRDGPIIVHVLPENELGIEAPAGVEVAPTRGHSQRGSWLPARPKLSAA